MTLYNEQLGALLDAKGIIESKRLESLSTSTAVWAKLHHAVTYLEDQISQEL
jgi:hypothetical protein